jgi:energy-coupling factor transporter ATP-binding protein EcfA2
MRIGRAGREAGRVEVPFEFIMPSPGERWRGDAARGFEIPIGRAGATRRQLFRLGQGTAQHALVAGKTGSGKSTLLHALITNLALLYSPDEAELYLIDFKKGVEFKAYAEAQLPHARVIAIESEREFGVSVLQRLDGILRERGDRFREAGVNDLAGYRAFLKQHQPAATCPRVLLIVDEFQEFFVEDDKLAQETGLLLDRLVRQGRAFGVHVLLGSQTLGGAYSLARSTIDQMAVRIALQCSEADAQLILSKDNTAARLLNRPGEAIYNDANGLTEGNDPFQVVWLPEERRQTLLEDLRTRAIAAGRVTAKPLVFEGNATANLWDNPILQAKLQQPETIPADRSPWQLFLGEPIAIQEPTQVTLRAQGGSHLLVLGSQEDTALSLWASLTISARVGRSAAAVHWLHATPDDSEYAPYLQQLVQALGLSATTYPAEQTLATLEQFTSACEARRNGHAPKTPQLLMLLGLHRLREIRKPEEDFGFGRKERAPSAGELLSKLLRDGPAVGLHVVAWCDSLPNLNRAIDRASLREFGFKVLLQMSATDSSQLIDTPAASRLGRHRALLLEEGTERPQKFRPYSLPAPSALPESFRQKLPEPPASPSDTPATELC